MLWLTCLHALLYEWPWRSLSARTGFVMNKFPGAWESKSWTYLVLYSPLAKLFYLIWMAVTVFPTLWLVCVVLFIDLGKVIWWRALANCRWYRSGPKHEFLLMLNWDHWVGGELSSQKIQGSLTAMYWVYQRNSTYIYVDWRYQHFLNIVFCGKPCLLLVPSAPSPLGLSQ